MRRAREVSPGGLHRAHQTLRRGAALIGERPGRGTGAEAPDRAQARFIGNCLRELDRFLSVMADEASRCLEAAADDAAFARLHNAANKLRAVRAMMRLDSPDHERLRAIGRVRACFHHCEGRIHDIGAWATMFGADLSFGELGAGATLRLPPAAMDRILLLYRNAGDDLLREVARARPGIDFADPKPHLASANVACDGM